MPFVSLLRKMLLSVDLTFGVAAATAAVPVNTPAVSDEVEAVVESVVVVDTIPGATVALNAAPSAPVDNSVYRFRPNQLALPLALMAVGTFGVYNGAFRTIDRNINRWTTKMRGGTHYFKHDDYLQYLTAATYLGFGAIGVKGRNGIKERLAAGVTAYIVMAAITNVAKYTFREQRPNGGGRHSFPSGHTATVFTGAELMRIEYGNGIGAAAYTFGAAVGFLRLYNSRHWLHDVIAGAGVGILSARIGYWMLPLYQKWFHWRPGTKDTTVIALPSYNHYNNEFAVNMAITF